MSMKNMVAMFGAMAVLQRIDQEEPLVLLYARLGYLVYFATVALIYAVLHFRIVARRDETLVTVPITTKSPSFSDAFEQFKKASEKAEQDRLRAINGDNESTTSSATNDASASETQHATRLASNSSNASSNTSASTTTNVTSASDNADNEGTDANTTTAATAAATDTDEKEEETETITTMEYDLRQLAAARRSWATGSCFLAAIHYHMESVSPLFMSAVMGFVRLVTEDQLVQIHILGAAAVGKLNRPFPAEKNPLAAMLKEFGPKEDDDRPQEHEQTQRSVAQRQQQQQEGEEDVHDDGDDDDEDDAPVAIADMKDDHIKSDFDDEETAEDDEKTQ